MLQAKTCAQHAPEKARVAEHVAFPQPPGFDQQAAQPLQPVVRHPLRRALQLAGNVVEDRTAGQNGAGVYSSVLRFVKASAPAAASQSRRLKCRALPGEWPAAPPNFRERGASCQNSRDGFRQSVSRAREPAGGPLLFPPRPVDCQAGRGSAPAAQPFRPAATQSPPTSYAAAQRGRAAWPQCGRLPRPDARRRRCGKSRAATGFRRRG